MHFFLLCQPDNLVINKNRKMNFVNYYELVLVSIVIDIMGLCVHFDSLSYRSVLGFSSS